MSYAAQNDAIRSRFYTNWSATPVKYDNADFVAPANAAFVVLEIHNADEQPASYGGSTGNGVVYRSYGIISLNVYVPLNTGTTTLNTYCDTAAVVFRGQQFSGITCYGAKITRLGEIDGRFVANISIEFIRDEEF